MNAKTLYFIYKLGAIPGHHHLEWMSLEGSFLEEPPALTRHIVILHNEILFEKFSVMLCTPDRWSAHASTRQHYTFQTQQHADAAVAMSNKNYEALRGPLLS